MLYITLSRKFVEIILFFEFLGESATLFGMFIGLTKFNLRKNDNVLNCSICNVIKMKIKFVCMQMWNL